MPMASEDTLPQAIDFLSLCENCHKMVGQLWLVNGSYVCDDCYANKKKIHECKNYKKIEIKFGVEVVQKNIYGWTKWYGANNNLFVITPEWYCQSCGEKETDELPSYLIRIIDQEYARICSVCLNVALKRKINNLFSLMKIQHPHPSDF